MKKIVLIVIVSFWSIYSFSQVDTTRIIPIEEVVVTAQRSPRSEMSVPFSTGTLERIEINRDNPRSTPEALMNRSGVFIQKTNHGGGSPILRGLTGNQTLLLVDGIRLNNSIFRYGPNQYLNTVDLYSIEKIEIAKGTGSVQYGSDAMGGTIQLFTKELNFTEKERVLAGGLSGKYVTGNMEKTGHGNIEFSNRKFAVMAGATGHIFGDLIGGKNTGKQAPSGYNEFAFDSKIGFKLNKNSGLIFSGQFLKQLHVPLYHKVVLENFSINEFDPQQRVLSFGRFYTHGKSHFFRKTILTAVWQQGIEGRYSNKNGNAVFVNEKDKINTKGITAEINSEFSQIWTATSGIEVYKDKVNSYRQDFEMFSSAFTLKKRGLYPDGSLFSSYSAYSLHHLNLRKWLFDGGVRFNAFAITISDENLGDVKVKPEALVFNGAAMYKFNKQNHIYINLSNGFRAPNIDDMGTLGIVDFRYEIPAYNLKPEKSQNYELGFKHSRNNLFASVAAYYINLNQLITRTKLEGEMINGYPVYKKENVEKAFIRGMEAAFKWKITPMFDLNGNISSTYGQNITKNEPMRRIPPLNGRLDANFFKGNFFSSFEFLFASKQDRLAAGDKSDNRIPAGGTPGWKVLNLTSGYTFGAINLRAGLQNLFNEDYRTHGSGINGIGRSGWIAMNYIF